MYLPEANQWSIPVQSVSIKFFSSWESMKQKNPQHSDCSFLFPFFCFFPPFLFFLPVITAVVSGVGVQMGCRSTPLPFFSLTPSPLLLLTRLSGALTLPGNKPPVIPTCQRCHNVIYLLAQMSAFKEADPRDVERGSIFRLYSFYLWRNPISYIVSKAPIQAPREM